MVTTFLKKNIINYKGWKTKRKIVVIESDDWGSIRMPSKKVFENFVSAGIPLNICPYNSFDSLETPKDFEDIFNVISKHKDQYGNTPIITGNVVMANPNFEKILASNFSEYFFEPFIDTYLRNSHTLDSFNYMNEGIRNNFFFPQFHGREHVNVNKWFSLLRSRDKIFLKAFDHNFWGIGPSIIGSSDRINIQASFDAKSLSELEFHQDAINNGLKLFEQIFKFKSETFIANNFIWHTSLNKVLKLNGVNGLQGMKYQYLPIFDRKQRERIRHFIGQINHSDQIHLVRNCAFEPSANQQQDSVMKCFDEIKNSFFWNRPAVISIHRLNFIGSVVSKNREKNLKLFDQLLKLILSKWPDVEFMHSAQLVKTINS